MTLFQDSHLIVFSPLHEPSGTGTFRNFSPSGILKPSGISFDWHVHVTDADIAHPQAWWPGTDSVVNPESGTIYFGYRVQGSGLPPSIAFPNATDVAGLDNKVLVLGQGTFANRHVCVPPTSAQSGFTVGYWVYPNSDGAFNIMSRQGMTNANLARFNALISKADNANGFHLGISGRMDKATQFGSNPNNTELRAYAFVLGTNNLISIPIESGRFTHLTFVYRFVDGTNNTIALFKDGRLGVDRTNTPAASGTTTTELTDSNANYRDRVLTIGGTTLNAPGADKYIYSTGWGHLISGVYVFQRPLHDGEVALLHDQGGLQPDYSLLKPMTPISINDPTIISYYPGISPGYIDVGSNHYNLFSEQDEGPVFNSTAANNKFTIFPGPNDGSLWHILGNTGQDNGIATGSGVINEIINSRSFTIAAQMHSLRNGVTFPLSTIMSFGSISTVEGGTGAAGTQNMGFHMSVSGAAPSTKFITRVARDGDSKSQVTLRSQDADPWLGATQHVALVYDDQTFGLAYYLNGELAESGILLSSMATTIARLAGKGFPIVFGNGITDTNIDTMSNTADDSTAVGQVFIAGRPLLESEIRFLAISGINITPLYFSVQDPRLRGYWPCTDSTKNDFIIRDRARVFQNPNTPGHLTKFTSDVIWDAMQASDTRGALYRLDPFNSGINATLGITSGSWAVMGGSPGTNQFTTPATRNRTSSTDFTQRYQPCAALRSDRSPYFNGELVWAFDVTPSGTIPPTYDNTGQEFNSLIITYGPGESAANRLYSFMTSIDAPLGSGVTLVWMAKDTGTTPTTVGLVSGLLSYGIPNRMLFHAKPLLPNSQLEGTPENNPVQFSLYNSGTLVDRRILNSNQSLFYSDDTFANAAREWLLTIGSRAITSNNAHGTTFGGLGGIHIKELYCMVGKFNQSGIHHLSVSGLYTNSPYSLYSDDTPTTDVTLGDQSLQGYWRFSDTGSGTKDYSTKTNHLRHLAREVAEKNLFPANSNAAHNLRYAPALYGDNTTQSVVARSSGITYNNKTFTAANSVAPFVTSGTGFNTPNQGFTVGFWLCQRETVSTLNDADIIVSFGRTPTVTTSTTFIDASWAVVIDDTQNIKMLLSKNGSMPMDNGSSTVNVTECAIYRDTGTAKPDNCIEVHNKGFIFPGHIDSWQHVMWSYNNATSIIKAYLNGAVINERLVPASGFHVPELVETRIMNILVPMSALWTWDPQLAAFNEIISDLFYMSRAVTDAEAFSIVSEGFMNAPSVSGVVGGYLTGQGEASGIIGGWLDGFDTFSGVVGGYLATTNEVSGVIGGYLATQDSTSGLVGGLLTAIVQVSGLVGGYLASSAQASGMIGGWLNPGLSSSNMFDATFVVDAIGTKDFDSQITIERTATADFDAQINIFEEELPPDIAIIIPNRTVSGLAPPFNQYFIGSGVARQGKTINQAIWDFGDFSPTENISASGVNFNFFPAHHRFAQSGLYIVTFALIDSDGVRNMASRVIDCSSGIAPIMITLSGTPTEGLAPLSVQFNQRYESIPANVSILNSLLKFGDGQSTSTLNTKHVYSEPKIYIPSWVVKDSRGFIFSDDIEPGVYLR